MNILFFLIITVMHFTTYLVQSESYISQLKPIGNGYKAKLGQIPYQALLILQKGDVTSLCGGSLISPKWVLTASHCVHDVSNATVTLGTTHLFNTGPEKGRVVMVSTNLIAHPKSRSKDGSTNYPYDIGLIELPEEVELSDVIDTIDLPDSNPEVGRSAIASGWGLTSDLPGGSPSPDLLYTPMTVTYNFLCQLFFGISNKNILCVNGAANGGTCQGDSGGPLTGFVGEQRVLIGATSFGSAIKGTCKSWFFRGFVNIYMLLDFIYEETGIDQD